MRQRRARKGRRGRKGLRTSVMEKIGAERIEMLMEEAGRSVLAADDELALRYMVRARKIGMRLNLKTMGKYRGEFCRNCLMPFVSASKFRVRMHGGRVVITCLNCGAIYRKPLRKGKCGDSGISTEKKGRR